MEERNGIAKGACGCAMTKLGCAFTSCGAPTSSISAGRRGCCAEAAPKEINIKPQPKMAANQCRVVIFFVFIFLFEAGFLNCINCNPVPRGTRRPSSRRRFEQRPQFRADSRLQLDLEIALSGASAK